jgi:DNA-binding NarL/FixJ family response regulator
MLVGAHSRCNWSRVSSRKSTRTQRATEVAPVYVGALVSSTGTMKEHFERHRQPWTPSEIAKLHQFVAKGMSLKAISKALTRSEESIKTRAKLDKLDIAKKR